MKQKKRDSIRNLFRATQVGLEPMTSAVTGQRSNQLSYWAKKIKNLRFLTATVVCVANDESGTKCSGVFFPHRVLCDGGCEAEDFSVPRPLRQGLNSFFLRDTQKYIFIF